MAATIRIDTSGLDQTLASFQNFRPTLIKWAQVGMMRFILPKLKAIVPVRTGRLKAARVFDRTENGGAFGWDRKGFYWRFQPGLPEESVRIVEMLLPRVLEWATAQTTRELGLD